MSAEVLHHLPFRAPLCAALEEGLHDPRTRGILAEAKQQGHRLREERCGSERTGTAAQREKRLRNHGAQDVNVQRRSDVLLGTRLRKVSKREIHR